METRIVNAWAVPLDVPPALALAALHALVPFHSIKEPAILNALTALSRIHQLALLASQSAEFAYQPLYVHLAYQDTIFSIQLVS